MVESPEEIRRLAEPLHSQVVDTLAYAIRGVFLFAIPVVAIAWAATFFLKELPLRSSSPLEQSKVAVDSDEEAASMEAASAIV